MDRRELIDAGFYNDAERYFASHDDDYMDDADFYSNSTQLRQFASPRAYRVLNMFCLSCNTYFKAKAREHVVCPFCRSSEIADA